MPKRDTPPSITETAFVCPHCEAYANHQWFMTFIGPSLRLVG